MTGEVIFDPIQRHHDKIRRKSLKYYFQLILKSYCQKGKLNYHVEVERDPICKAATLNARLDAHVLRFLMKTLVKPKYNTMSRCQVDHTQFSVAL